MSDPIDQHYPYSGTVIQFLTIEQNERGEFLTGVERMRCTAFESQRGFDMPHNTRLYLYYDFKATLIGNDGLPTDEADVELTPRAQFFIDATVFSTEVEARAVLPDAFINLEIANADDASTDNAYFLVYRDMPALVQTIGTIDTYIVDTKRRQVRPFVTK